MIGVVFFVVCIGVLIDHFFEYIIFKPIDSYKSIKKLRRYIDKINSLMN